MAASWRSLALFVSLTVSAIYADTKVVQGSEGTCSIDDNGRPACVDHFNLNVLVGVGCKPKKYDRVTKAKNSNVAKNCGEDAYYVVGDTNSKYASVGVADGVGGWQESGVDPSAFSLALVDGAKISFMKTKEQPKPLQLLEDAFAHVKAGGDKNPGGSTAVFLVFDRETGLLETANLGDSGYLIIRNDKKFFRSVEQTWAFNAPYQLSQYPSWMRNEGDHYLPKDSFLTKHSLQHGDIIILGSDGLFDNVFDEDILDETKRAMDRVYQLHPALKTELNDNKPFLTKEAATDVKKAMSDLSYSLTLMANSFAHDNTRESPFSKLAREGYGYKFDGGKVDDTTVVAVYVHGTMEN